MPTLFQICSSVNWGSVDRIAEQIGQIAILDGWESYITYARYHLPSKSKVIKIGNKLDVYWHGINSRLFDNHCLKSTSATKKLITQIKTIKPDIIQIHNIHGYFLNMCVLFDYLSKIEIPIVWVFHDCWSMTGHCAHFDAIGCKKWITGCYECPQKRGYPASIFLDKSKRNYALKKELFNNVSNMTIVPVSNWLGEIVRKSFLNQYPLQIIQNGIDVDIFSMQTDLDTIRKKYNMENKFIILGVTNTWEKRKGLEDFISLNEIIDHYNYKIVLVGLNKRQLKELPEDIIGIERTNNVQKLVEFYSFADVFLNPTYQDTFPTTNLESLACGTPVITYYTGGSVESISEDTGFVIKQGDINGIYETIKKIKEKGKLFYSSNCRKRAISHYDKKNRFKDYMNLYYQLLGKQKELL
ncbi:glycosyl transferase [Spirochaetia bacterium]|nr:glycosyl transferase [Spirochaetia bacterium]